MARKIILKEDGLNGAGAAPTGYKYLGDDAGTVSQKVGATVSGLGGSEWTETIVNISASQLLNLGTSPVELLPARRQKYSMKSFPTRVLPLPPI